PSLPSSHDPATLVIYTLSLHDALPIFADEAGERDQKIPGRRVGYYRQVCRYLFVGSDVAHIQKEALSGRHCAPLAGGVCDPRTSAVRGLPGVYESAKDQPACKHLYDLSDRQRTEYGFSGSLCLSHGAGSVAGEIPDPKDKVPYSPVTAGAEEQGCVSFELSVEVLSPSLA